VEEVFLGLYLLVLVVVILASGLIMAYYRHFHPRYALHFNKNLYTCNIPFHTDKK
jgi:hypothetical protein